MGACAVHISKIRVLLNFFFVFFLCVAWNLLVHSSKRGWVGVQHNFFHFTSELASCVYCLPSSYCSSFAPPPPLLVPIIASVFVFREEGGIFIFWLDCFRQAAGTKHSSGRKTLALARFLFLVLLFSVAAVS